MSVTPFFDAYRALVVVGESFSEAAFATLLRAELGLPRSRFDGLITATPHPNGLDEAPDICVAWVFGLYSSILDRMPDAGGLAHHAGWLREGGSPKGLADSLVHSDEAVLRGAEVPTQLEEAFVTGAYLAVLGRYPEAQGLMSYCGALAQGATPEAVFRELSASVEAFNALRFPPPPTNPHQMLAEALQFVVLDTAPTSPLTDHLVARLSAGSKPVHLVRWLLLRTRNPLQAARGLGAGRLALAAQLRASTETIRLDVLAARAWQWRVDRVSLGRSEGFQGQLEGVRAQLHDLTTRLSTTQCGTAP